MLVHRIIYNFIYQMIQALSRNAADIHTRPFPHGFKPFKHRNTACVICIFFCHICFLSTQSQTFCLYQNICSYFDSDTIHFLFTFCKPFSSGMTQIHFRPARHREKHLRHNIRKCFFCRTFPFISFVSSPIRIKSSTAIPAPNLPACQPGFLHRL